MTEDGLFEVASDMQKHLSRNVPSDFAAYLEQVEHSQRGNNALPVRGVDEAIRKMGCAICSEPSDELDADLKVLIQSVGLRYEALNRSVDFTIAPRPVYEALEGVIRVMTKTAQRKLSDDYRDERVASDRGLMSIGEFEIDAVPFADAKSLAEKATMARLKLLQVAEELGEIRDHFQYKMGKNSSGKPGLYAMFYAVFALGDFFATRNEFGNKATINFFDEIHSGRFLTFTHAFFAIVNPQVANLAGDTFPESVRKIAQRRPHDPECYRLLDGKASTQDLLDFMDRIDRLR